MSCDGYKYSSLNLHTHRKKLDAKSVILIDGSIGYAWETSYNTVLESRKCCLTHVDSGNRQ